MQIIVYINKFTGIRLANDKLQITGFFALIMLIFGFGPIGNQARALNLANPGVQFYVFLSGNIDLILLVIILFTAGLLMYDIAVDWF